MLPDLPLLLLAGVVGAFAVGRAARLLTHDSFPPTVAVRAWYVNHVPARWADLAECPFCMAPYLAAGDIAWAATAGIDDGGWWTGAWWIVNLWAAVSYLAAIIVAYDEPAD